MSTIMEYITGSMGALTAAMAVMLLLLVLFSAMALYARNYIKVPPSEVAIFYGRKHTIVDDHGVKATVGFRIVRGGAALLIPILENHQQQDGTVRLPKALVPYMGGREVIGRPVS